MATRYELTLMLPRLLRTRAATAMVALVAIGSVAACGGSENGSDTCSQVGQKIQTCLGSNDPAVAETATTACDEQGDPAQAATVLQADCQSVAVGLAAVTQALSDEKADLGAGFSNGIGSAITNSANNLGLNFGIGGTYNSAGTSISNTGIGATYPGGIGTTYPGVGTTYPGGTGYYPGGIGTQYPSYPAFPTGAIGTIQPGTIVTGSYLPPTTTFTTVTFVPWNGPANGSFGNTGGGFGSNGYCFYQCNTSFSASQTGINALFNLAYNSASNSIRSNPGFFGQGSSFGTSNSGLNVGLSVGFNSNNNSFSQRSTSPWLTLLAGALQLIR